MTEKSENFYGIEIDLSEANKTVKTVADYELEKKNLSGQVQVLKQINLDLSQQLEGDKEKLKKKYQPKIREQKDIIREIDYNLGAVKKQTIRNVHKTERTKSKGTN